MSYTVKKIFYTLQGAGAQTGRPAVFCRFAGCNLWSGREIDRSTAACQFCDTDFEGVDELGGGEFESAVELAGAIEHKRPSDASSAKRFVICTGGEPILQLDAGLIEALHLRDFEIAIGHFYLQPMDGPSRTINTDLAVRYCLDHPVWRLEDYCIYSKEHHTGPNRRR